MPTLSKLPNIQVSVLDGRAQSHHYKKDQFRRLHDLLTTSANNLKVAIQADSALNPTEADFEIARALLELRMHYESLDLQRDLVAARKVESGVDNSERVRPVGVVYIIPSKSNLTFSTLSVLGAAIAAGSCIVVELPQTLTKTSAVLRQILTDALDSDTFAMSTSRPPTSFTRNCLLVHQTDEEINPLDWSQVLSSTSAVGAVAVVDRTANISRAAEAISMASFSFGGKSTYTPQLVLVNEFIADSLLSELVSILAHNQGVRHENGSRVGRSRETTKDIWKSEKIKIVASAVNGRVVEVLDRDFPFFQERCTERAVAVHRISSLDDALNVLKGQQLTASFIFAGLPEANYLSRFTTAALYTINHIPVELLLGPAAPAHPSRPPAAFPRYVPAMFTLPAPQYMPRKLSIQSLAGLKDQALINQLTETAMKPLSPIVRGNGHQLNFFGQAIFLGLGMTLTSIIGASIGGLYLMLKKHPVR